MAQMSAFEPIHKDDHIKSDWWSWFCRRKIDGVEGYIQADGQFEMVAEDTFEVAES
jgi:hypothetical protein